MVVPDGDKQIRVREKSEAKNNMIALALKAHRREPTRFFVFDLISAARKFAKFFSVLAQEKGFANQFVLSSCILEQPSNAKFFASRSSNWFAS